MNNVSIETLSVAHDGPEQQARPELRQKTPYLWMWDSIDDLLKFNDKNAKSNSEDNVDAVPIK